LCPQLSEDIGEGPIQLRSKARQEYPSSRAGGESCQSVLTAHVAAGVVGDRDYQNRVKQRIGELRRLAREGVRVRLCGRTERLPAATRTALERLVVETAGNQALLLNLAVDYGSRREIGDAVRALVEEVRAGTRDADSIDERALASRLYTAGLPDPDLIVRTGGELRLSNFLLFQSAYAEFWATSTYWPDFDAAHFKSALADFALRQRRYGT